MGLNAAQQQAFSFGRAAMPGWHGQVPQVPGSQPDQNAQVQQQLPPAAGKGAGKSRVMLTGRRCRTCVSLASLAVTASGVAVR